MNRYIEVNLNDSNVQMLREADSKLGNLMDIIGNLNIPIKENRLEALIKSVIGQQLSFKAANTIFNRVKELCIVLTPDLIITLSEDELRNAGVSKAKISYIRDICEKIISNEVELESLDAFPNNQIVTVLTKIKGIGQWTAEMFLIFSLGRMDVLSLGDIGLQRSCKWLYNAGKEEEGRSFLAQKANQWHPNYTVASLYLWEAINSGYVDSFQSLDETTSKYIVINK